MERDKWYSYARILQLEDAEKGWLPGYFTDVTSNGEINDHLDDRNFTLEDEFVTIEDAQNDLAIQGYEYRKELGLWVLELSKEDVTINQDLMYKLFKG